MDSRTQTHSESRSRWRNEPADGPEDRTLRCYEIPATMPCPEYGESVPASSVQLVD